MTQPPTPAFHDPTDAHTPVTHPLDPPARLVEWLDQLHWRIVREGICSAPECCLPIDAWCGECGAKVCLDHLVTHGERHTRERIGDPDSDEEAAEMDEVHMVHNWMVRQLEARPAPGREGRDANA